MSIFCSELGSDLFLRTSCNGANSGARAGAGAKVEIGSSRGTSSHQYNPAVILCDRRRPRKTASCYGLCFAYSGNFVAGAQQDQRGLTRVQMGINPVQFRYTLAGGRKHFSLRR